MWSTGRREWCVQGQIVELENVILGGRGKYVINAPDRRDVVTYDGLTVVTRI